MTFREELQKKVAEETDIPEDVVHKIISFQGEDALKAVKKVHELEFSGFGKFLLSQTKIKKKLKMYEGLIEKNPDKAEEFQAKYEDYKTKLL